MYVSLFSNIPVEEALHVNRNRLNMEPSFRDRSPLQVEHTMELLDIYVKTMCFHFADKLY